MQWIGLITPLHERKRKCLLTPKPYYESKHSIMWFKSLIFDMIFNASETNFEYSLIFQQKYKTTKYEANLYIRKFLITP